MGEAEEVRRMIDSTHAMSTEHCRSWEFSVSAFCRHKCQQISPVMLAGNAKDISETP